MGTTGYANLERQKSYPIETLRLPLGNDRKGQLEPFLVGTLRSHSRRELTFGRSRLGGSKRPVSDHRHQLREFRL